MTTRSVGPGEQTFAFTGRTPAGRLVQGQRSAMSVEAAVAALQRERIVVSRIHRPTRLRLWSRRQVRGRTVSAKHLAVFTRQLAVMLGAGVPVSEGLAILSSQEQVPHFQATIDDLRTVVADGSRLGDALRRHPQVFGSLYVSMVVAGEVSGRLDSIVVRLATLVEKQVVLRGHVTSAMVYPATVIAIAALVLSAILWKVIPTFATLFDGLGAPLPVATRLVIRMSELFISMFPLVCLGVVGVGWGLRRYRASDAGRRALDQLTLRLPVVGVFVRKVAVARFCRTLGTLLSSGVPILEGLETTARTAGNAVLEDAVMRARDAVEDGQPLSAPLHNLPAFPPLVTHMVLIGETAGSLDATLTKVAEFYEDDVDVSARGLVALLEPVMIAGVGIVVGGIVVAMYLPIFDLVTRLAF